MVFPGRMIHAACVSLILPAELTFGIAALNSIARCSDRLGIFFRLGQIDGDIQLAIIRSRLPFHISCDAVPADIVRVSGIGIIPVGSCLRAFLIFLPEHTDDLGGSCHEVTHQSGIKQIPCHDRIAFRQPFRYSIIQDFCKERFQCTSLIDHLRGEFCGCRQDIRFCPFKIVQLQIHQQLIHRIDHILCGDKSCGNAIACQTHDIFLDLLHPLLSFCFLCHASMLMACAPYTASDQDFSYSLQGPLPISTI